MKTQNTFFIEHDVLHELKHYLPAQAPLKDFIHHNTLHAFQNLKFDQAIYSASEILGYRVSLSLSEYRALYDNKRIREDILERSISIIKMDIRIRQEILNSASNIIVIYITDITNKA